MVRGSLACAPPQLSTVQQQQQIQAEQQSARDAEHGRLRQQLTEARERGHSLQEEVARLEAALDVRGPKRRPPPLGFFRHTRLACCRRLSRPICCQEAAASRLLPP